MSARAVGWGCRLPLDVVIHIHQVADRVRVVGDIGVAADRVLDHAAGHREIDHVHGLVVVDHGVDQAAGEGVAAADPVEDIEGEHFALEGVALVPHERFQAVLASAVGVAHVAGDALQVRVALHERLEHFVLLFVAGPEGNAVFHVAFAVVVFVLPQMVGLDAHEHIHVRQALGAEVARLFPGPQGAAEVAVEADGQAVGFGDL